MAGEELVIGIDLGTADSYVSFIRKGSVDIVQNEVSQRKTPTLVGFTDKERLLGDAALSQIKSNAKNTCRNFKHLLGQKIDSPGVEEEKFFALSKLTEADDGFAAYDVMYKEQSQAFSATVITAMFLTKLIEITESWCQGKVAHAVIGVPSYFSDVHRTAVLDAANIAGLNVLRVMNEHTATALGYGFTRLSELDAEKPLIVAICMMGHAIFSVSIVQFVKGKLTVLCEKSDKVGGRDMDACMLRKFSKEFEKKNGCNPLESKKAIIKLEDQVQKTKKILSANSEASCGCECLMEDHDFSSHIERSDFEQMCEPMKGKVIAVLEAAKAGCGLPVSAIDVVEICGGASRVPWVKEACSAAFGGKDLSTRMNADECVARGCAIQAAILSPLFKVGVDFKVEDVSPFPITLNWKSLAAGGDVDKVEDYKSVTIFPANSLVHLLKLLTFFRKEPFELVAKYADDKALVPGTSTEIGTYRIEVPSQGTAKKVKVKVALTLHGTFVLESAQLVEDDGEAPAENDKENADEAQPDANGKDGSEEGKARKRRKLYKRTDIEVKQISRLGLNPEAVEKLKEHEEVMRTEMQEIVETRERQNDLESYLLNMRNHVAEGGKYRPFITAEDADAFMGQLTKAEDWLYDHMEDGRQSFIDKLAELKVLGDPVESRYKQNGEREEFCSDLIESAKGYKESVKELDATKRSKVEKLCEETLKWLTGMREKQKGMPKQQDPVLTSEELRRKRDDLRKLANEALKGSKEAAADEPFDGDFDPFPGGSPPPPSSSPLRNSMDVD